MTSFLFHSGRFLDPRVTELRDGIELLVEDGLVKEVADRPIRSDTATRVDLKGRTVLPGLIAAHIHIFLSEVNIQALESVPLTLLAAKAGVLMRDMLMRGFTAVRDTAGGDFGMKIASEQGFFDSPPLFVSCIAISQTAAHPHFRPPPH